MPGFIRLDTVSFRFTGAGTTVLASVLEGYEAIGIEATDAYYRLGSDRVRFTLQAREEAAPD